MFKIKIAIYKTTDGNMNLLFDIIEFTDDKVSGLIAKIRTWLDELGPY